MEYWHCNMWSWTYRQCKEHDNAQYMHMSFNSLHAQVKELDLVIILHVWQLAIASLQETMANLI